MKNIYYLQTHPVKIGDVIEHNGFKATVTEELIELNPELFRVEKNTQPMYFKCKVDSLGFTVDRVYEQTCHDSYPGSILIQDDDNTGGSRIYNWQGVRKGANNYGFELTTKAEWDKQELLDKAKRDFPAGTVYRSLFGKIYTVGDKSSYSLGAGSIILIDGMYIYRDGRWAEVLPLKFTTEDGVDIYGDMKTWVVDKGFTLRNQSNYAGAVYDYKYFYHKENALAYIEKHKKKTLDDYEDILLTSDFFMEYHWLKDNEPKLYYTKILQLIADDLNGDWEPDFNNERQKKWFIDTLGVKAHCSVNYGLVYFKSRELAEKARVILGDKLSVYLIN